MISLKNIHFKYPKSNFKLEIKDLTIEKGSKVAFVGPSGSGKTTLLRLIAGIYVPENGFINIDEITINRLSDAQRRNFRIANIGFVFQDFELIDYLDVFENILIPYLINRSLNLDNSVRNLAREIAISMDLKDKLERPVGKLSQGERQRVAICRAILTNPQIILADEPTGNLDSKNKDRIVKILFDKSKKTNSTLLMVTHDQSLLEGFDRVLNFQDFRSDS